jgi:elongation factor G
LLRLPSAHALVNQDDGELRTMHQHISGSRAVALVGPAGAGKTALAEAMLFASGAIDRLGSTAAGTSVGDGSPEARARGGSTELNLLHFDYLGEHFHLIDCPGSVGFAADGARALAVADCAVVVVDPDPARAPLAAPALRALDEMGIPHLIFVNRIDKARGRIRDLLAALQPMSVSPLIARQVPIRDGESVTGFVDIALERAFQYASGQPSTPIPCPADLAEREGEARTHLLEQLADHDDELLEQLLSDQQPAPEAIFADLARETGDNLGVPVLFGSAGNTWGVRRLLKALRHEAPGPDTTARRLGVTEPALYAFKVDHGGAAGRLVHARLLGGDLGEAAILRDAAGDPVRIGALFAMQGQRTHKLARASDGAVVALAKVDSVKAGAWIGTGALPPLPEVALPERNCTLAIRPAERRDDVKLSGALARLLEEDGSLALEHHEDSHELRLAGVNDEHLQVQIARLKRRYGVEVAQRSPSVGYRESIRRTVSHRGRHKKQSGGHGQFGDVVIEVSPQPRGAGFAFHDRIHGGAIPRQYIPAVEQGVRDALARGPLGFPVVDVAVALTDGSFHSVDSSELAFRTAGRIAMSEALAAAVPHLLEPVHLVEVVTPAAAASRVTAAIASRRGQMLGMVPRDGWAGWDRVDALIPEAELAGLEAELRAASQGLATYHARFEHLAELNGPSADKVVEARVGEAA